MFEGAATDLDSPDIYSRFRTEPQEVKAQAPGLISDFVHQPGAIVSPTDITDKVVADLERVKNVSFHVPAIYGGLPEVPGKQKARRRIAFKTSPKLKVKQGSIFISMAVASIVLGVYLTFSGLHSNHVAQAQAVQLSNEAAASGNAGDAPSATKPTPAAVATYSVAANLPKYLNISKLGVHARILALGTTKSGALSAPGSIYDVGWYKQSAKPGQNGAMLIDGHVSNWQAKGVFYGLNKLVAGDSFSLTRGDNKTFNYKVVKTQIFDSDKVDMASLLVSADPNKPGLNLISCSGDVIPGTNEFNKRIAIYAVQI